MKVFPSFVAANFHVEPYTIAQQYADAAAITATRPIHFAMSVHHAVRDGETLANRPAYRRIITLGDIFMPKRFGWNERNDENVHIERDKPSSRSSSEDKNRAPLHRLDRLQEVANLAVEERLEKKETWGCADIGTDHGFLAICLHANGANVIAVDRAAGPLEVARQNVGSYLQHAKHAMGNANLTRETADHAVQDSVCEGIPRLECRLGNGLSALAEGEVDTVCIAGVGVKTMINILSHSYRSSNDNREVQARGSVGSHPPLDLPGLGVRRLVLQPMDARLDYMRRLRVWLRDNNWEITEETIVATPGKGGRHAFITIRADRMSRGCTEERGTPPAATVFSGWTGGFKQQTDWLGKFLPLRATDPQRQMQGAGGAEENRREAETFLAYLRHQRNWLSSIQRIRSENERGTAEGDCIALGVNGVLLAVDEAIRVGAGGPTDVRKVDDAEGFAQARNWRIERRLRGG